MPSLSSTSRFLNGKRLTMSSLHLRSIRSRCTSPALANAANEDGKNVPQRLNRLRESSQTASDVPTRAKAPNFLAQCLSGFENPLPRTKVRGYTPTSIFPQPVKPSMAGIFASRLKLRSSMTNFTFRRIFWLALGGTILSLPLHGQSQSEILKDYDQAIDQVAEHAMQSEVEIQVTGYGVPEKDKDQGDQQQSLERQRSLGSGVIVDPDGYIMTNNHVVAGALRIRVVVAPATVEMVSGNTHLHNPQRVYEAKLIGTTHYADLALIKIEAKDLPVISLPERFHFRLGQTVIAIGAPEGLDHTVTRGIISAVGRQPEVDRPMGYIQTDAPINPGTSAAPLIDRNGKLVGINTFIVTSGGGSEGLGFAIPEPVVRFVFHELRDHGNVSNVTIGAHAQTITPALAAGLKLPQDWGVILTDIDHQGPAGKAGLEPRDIVTAVDGIQVDSLPKYTALLYIHPRDTPVGIGLLREG